MQTTQTHQLELENLTEGEIITHIHRSPFLTFTELITILQQYYPQIRSASQLDLMVWSEPANRWHFLTRDFRHVYINESQPLRVIFQEVIDDQLYADFKQTKQYIDEVGSILQNAEDYWQDVRKVISEPFDVHLFWASPYFTEDNYDRKPLTKYKKHNNKQPASKQTVLRYSVKYTPYFEAIIKSLRKSRKNVLLSIDNFHAGSFKTNNKKKFSVVYLVCHTEVIDQPDEQEDLVVPTKSEKKYSKKSTESVKEQKEDQEEDNYYPKERLPGIDLTQSFEMILDESLSPKKKESVGNSQEEEWEQKMSSPSPGEEAPHQLKKNFTADQFSAQLTTFKMRTASSYSDKTLKKPHRKKKMSESGKKKNIVYYFVGEDPDGKLVQITPEKLSEMLSSKSIQIQLLILQTSYPFKHTEVFKRHARNIILINTNALIPDESAAFFLQKYFQYLLEYGQISKAYFKTVADTQARFPGVQCCCFHEHTSSCTSNFNMRPSKYDGYHYMYHINRCWCPQRHLLKHFCQEKQKLAQRDYRIIKPHNNNLLSLSGDKSHNHHSKSQQNSANYQKKAGFQLKKIEQSAQQANSILQQLFFCCCKTEEHLEHSFRKKFFDFQMPPPSTVRGIDFEIDSGQLNDKGEWLDAFCKQTNMVGNQQVIMALIKMFVPENSHLKNSSTIQKMRVFNLFGLPKTGKYYLAEFFAYLLIRKSKQRFMRWELRHFEEIKQIKDLEDDVFYIFKHRNSRNNRRKLRIKKSGEDSLPERINGIIITWKRIETQIPEIEAMETEPFDHDDQCGMYIKAGQNFNQQLKNKLKIYLKLALRSDQKYYPRSFQKQQIILALKRSKYDKDKLYQTFLSECYKIPIIDLTLIGGICLFTKKPNKMLQNQIEELRKLSKQASLKSSNESVLRFDSLKQFFPLVYQKYAAEIANSSIQILNIYVSKTAVCDRDVRFFEATTINQRSYISIYLQDLIIKNSHSKCPSEICGNPLFKQFVYESGLEFLQNVLYLHTSFSYLSIEQKEQLIKLGILLVNNTIILQKSKPHKDDESLELRSSVSLDSPVLDMSLSLEEQQQAQLVNLETMCLVSRKGLVYLLDRLMDHIPYQAESKQHLRIICQELKIQLYFESKYESEKLHQTFNEEVGKIIFSIVETNDKIKPKMQTMANILQYDFVLALTLLYTNCGRQPMTRNAQTMIAKARKDGQSVSKLMRMPSTIDIEQQRQTAKSKLLSKMCSDKNIYNRLINNLLPNRDEGGNFEELMLYQDILTKWDILSKCEPQHNPLQAYHILQNMKKDLCKSGPNRRSHYLKCLFSDLDKKIDEKLNKLNKKLFVWMESHPVMSKKTQNILGARSLVKNTVIQEFNKESQRRRKMLAIKMKLNRVNLEKLGQIRGCRFLCLDLNLNKNDETEIIGELNESSEAEMLQQKEVVRLLQGIPAINLFISLRKPSLIVKQLKKLNNFKKDLVYFDFNVLHDRNPHYDRNSESFEKMIMMEVVRSIVHKMHFQRSNIIDAFEQTIFSLQFRDEKGNSILTNKELQRVAFLHFYDHQYQSSLADSQPQLNSITLSPDNIFDAQELQKVEQITKVCFPTSTLPINKLKSGQSFSHSAEHDFGDCKVELKINFKHERLLQALIQYLKLKEDFHHHLIINVEDCYKNYNSPDYGLFKTMKSQRILDLYYTAKKGILIFVHIQLIEDKGWEKQQFDRLFAKPQNQDPNSIAIKSVKVKISSNLKGKKSATDVLICFFDRIR